MATILRFSKIKETIISEVDKVINAYLNDWRYDQSKTQSVCNSISDEVSKILNVKGKGLKFACISNIF